MRIYDIGEYFNRRGGKDHAGSEVLDDTAKPPRGGVKGGHRAAEQRG